MELYIGDRLIQYEIDTNNCWNVTNYKACRNGYHEICINRKRYYIHRLIIQVYIDIPDNICVLHSCDNRSCINPEHLRLGTKKENTKDMIDRFRYRSNQKFEENEILDIILAYKSKNLSQEDLSKIYNVSQSTISFIVRRKSYKQIKT